MVSPVLLAAARSDRIRRLVTAVPLTRAVVDRFVAGEDLEAALEAVRELTGDGLAVTLDHLGEDTTDRAQAEATRDAYLTLFAAFAEHGLTASAEASVKLSALGGALPGGASIALDHAREIAAAAARHGMTVTLDMEDHTTVDATLAALGKLRTDFPSTGVAIQAMLRRTEGDLADLVHEGSRVRLVKGAYAEPASVAHQGRQEVDRAYVRALRTLMDGDGHPMVATHDPRVIEIALDLARRNGRTTDSYEFQMLYGIRAAEQRRLAASGERMRVYVPYGSDWYGYFMRRLAERPANLAFFLRSFVSR
ncbi:proline dehydrogenase family protein [Actinomadura xylanilytica]|uniref:proline dehydrogenase family protein n=1 Tax=Actinomadura xylanilytica TaxID=887459 RepID=UPI00255B0EE7|nr:proline dehydrogenase family protein [Actinomadura xylanilytica]MDL4772021.1 proline dehydrogenase family protein [Actinomadura xylanilytica]